ncbi:hypothetical protein [Kiloniella litopenaei]|uniref:hypothetical protein n=1 Tax=Kiloniella litopenaei TaxID=1549748 RepID=UPI003BAA0F2A
MARVFKLFIHIFSRIQAKGISGDVRNLPASIRRDIGLPADPDPPIRSGFTGYPW